MIPNTIAKKCSLVRGMGAAHRLACTPYQSAAQAMATYPTSKSASSSQEVIARVKDFAVNAAEETYSAAMLQSSAPFGATARSAPSLAPRSGLAMGRCSVRASTSPRSVLGATRGMKIATARPVNDGKQVDIEFADESAYRFHTAWIKDSHPSLIGSDFYRKSAQTLFESDQYTVDTAAPSSDGSKLQVHFKNGIPGNAVTEEYVSTWLHAFAPYVGQPLTDSKAARSSNAGLPGTGSLLEDLYRKRKPWDSTLDMPRFDGQQMLKDEDMQIEFLERMMDPGVALVENIGKPDSFDHVDCGKPLEDFVAQVVGRLNQHPVRATRFGVIHTQARGEQAGADYDHKNPLSMHTDHSVYHGTPGYLQFMYQARGSVRSKVVDGLMVAEYLRKNHPEDYELLTKVNLTHSSRNNIYAKSGVYRRDARDANDAEGFTFELVHTHPVLTLDKDGLLEKVVQSETKRGVSALPYDVYDRYMQAYKRWTALLEEARFKRSFDWPEHSMIVMNNWRILHSRAEVDPGVQRTMVFAYVMKTIYENRHRLLKQRQAERKNPEINDKWLCRLPNQILSSLVN
ncbi:Bbox1 [Symbiodinium necroappetens]|uniref:Bbox1 protein n=1 Tax=Symbiodinium necroappetens TaxID=1628268 RepID=A0A812TNX5_9DINO|nr:Bbox1 [Symbiodinium necroappetens]